MTLFLRLFVAAMIALMAAPIVTAELRPAGQTSPRQQSEEAAAPVTAEDLAGDWEGALDAGPQGQLRLVVHLTLDDDGALGATIDSVDQGATGIPVAGVELDGRTLTLDVAALGATYVGEVGDDLAQIDGDWRQVGNALTLLLTRFDAGDEE